jgi:Protein of unknown function (DUF2971)
LIATEETHFTGHKFRALNDFFWKSLQESTVYFSPPHQLNDPYDCQIDLMKAVRLATSGGEPSTEVIQRRWQDFIPTVTEPARTTGIFSLCAGDIRGMEERLLWAHYADNHRGVCLTFEIPYNFVHEQLVGFAPVRYGSEMLIESLKALNLSRHPDFKTEIKPIIAAYLTTKAEQWAYEHEARFISFDPGPVSIDKLWLRQVCFGLNTPTADRAAVIEKVKLYGYTNCVFAEMVHSDVGLFTLEVQPVLA